MITNILASYLETLTATNPICSALGDTFTFNENLFIGFEQEKKVSAITIIPYPGPKPNVDNRRQTAAIQLRLRTKSRYKSLSVQQACIDTLNMNDLNGGGRMRANSSTPFVIGSEENDKWQISVSSYIIKFVN